MNEDSHHAAVLTYLDEIKELFYSGRATEHSYRRPIENLIETLLPDVDAINEPKRVDVGAPDFVLTRRRTETEQLELIKSIPLGFIEAKDIKQGILDRPENKTQVERYMYLGNVIHTDGLTFRFYFERKLVKEISLGHVNEQEHIVSDAKNAAELQYWLHKTVEIATPTIRTAKMLALYMADRARPIRSTIQSALEQDIEANRTTDLTAQYNAFKEALIHDLSIQDFADIYAETIAYGLFAARYNDDSPNDFTLTEAAQKVPQTNPFLRQFFLQIAAYEQDVRLDWVLNNFADLFSHADVHKIMSSYGKDTGMNHDPVTHFYETFLAEYDSKRRKAKGVYYTPRPIVQYIVRAVDRVLKEEFGLADGLADDSTVTRTFNVAPYKKGAGTGSKTYHTEEREIPRVQILDPATGTGTFLNETIMHIAEQKAERLGSAWSDYVEKNLLPRIHGFEILMAAYSMAHMRLGLTLTETGYKPSPSPPRLGVYLTNALEEPSDSEPPLLSMLGMGRVLTEEAIQADKMKRDLPIMVVMGNPPYSVSSANKGKFIQKLISDYKKNLNERKINLDDDYIKFIRYAEHMIEKNGHGVLAMITNNSFIDGLTHREMRKHLIGTFDKIWILDLHGNTKKKEVAPDGNNDENVFEIMQGVAIMVMIKKTKYKDYNAATQIFHSELWGERTSKYHSLNTGIRNYAHLKAAAPNFFFIPRDTVGEDDYFQGISINDLFINKASGFRSGHDSAQVTWTREQVKRVVGDLINLSEDDYRQKYQLKDGRNHNYQGMRKDVGDIVVEDRIIRTQYRPFDIRWTYYSTKSSGYVAWPRNSTMEHFVMKSNIGLIYKRGYIESRAAPIGISDLVSHERTWSRPGMQGADTMAPLYTYNADGSRTPNFNDTQLKKLLSKMEFVIEDLKDDQKVASTLNTVTPENILDYIYAVLHSPTYRERYKEFLKIDYPHIPVPKDSNEFWNYVKFGKQLRYLHLMKDVTPGDYPLRGEGDGIVEKLSYVPGATSNVGDPTGRVYINSSQFFENVPEITWNYYIGGYQPAQKWLKDRKGRPLSYQDVEHYQKIIRILTETDRIMCEIGGLFSTDIDTTSPTK